MSLSRSMLKGMGLTDEQVDAIIEEHASAKDNLKVKIKSLEEQLKDSEEIRNNVVTMGENITALQANTRALLEESYSPEDIAKYGEAALAGAEL